MKIWQIEKKAPESLFKDNSDLNPIVLQLLYNRGLRSSLEMKEFISSTLDKNLCSSFFR